jgi:hypothetical protein
VYESEAEREAQDLRDYERARAKHEKYLEELREIASANFEDLPTVPPQAAQAERPGYCGGLTDVEEPDINAAARKVDQLVRQGMKRRFAIEEVYRSA